MTTTPAEGVGFRSKRGPVLIALMLSTGLVAIDATIVATAVPSIVHDIGGFTSFPWLFSAYLLAQAVSVPVYAKLSDTIGRKPIMLIGIGLFLLGSILCGFAWSMPALIAFRVRAGPGRGRRPADGHHHRRRHLHPGRAGQGAGLPRERVGGLLSGRPDARRRVLRTRHLALDLPRQHPAVPGGRVDAGPVVPRECRAREAPGRLSGRGAAHRLADPAHPRGPRGRPGLGLELRRISIAVFAGGALLFAAFILVERRAAEPVLPPWVFPAAAARRRR